MIPPQNDFTAQRNSPLDAKKDDIQAQYFLPGAALADITGISQDGMFPQFRETLQLGLGANGPMLDVATPCVFTPAVIIVTSIPAMYVRNGKLTVMGQLTKDLMESHAKSVSGIDFGYTLGTGGQSKIGHDGQEMVVPTKTTRGQVNPQFQFQELTGNIVFNWAKKWIWDIQHPDTNISMSNTGYNGPYTMSAYAASFMAIQFDPTMRPDRIIDAAHYVNVFPTGTGDLSIKRDIGSVETPERSISFTGIVQHNPYVKALAIAMAERLQLHQHNYDVAPPTHLDVAENLQTEYGLEGERSDRNVWVENARSSN